ncbi:MAG: NAD-dependent epimerase/dehydratase family protein [Candidatus Dormibacteria bacterium]
MPATSPPLRILVTGGAGFIGTHVVDALLDAGCEVVVVDDLRHRSARPLDGRARLVLLDVAAPGAAEALAALDAGAIVHLAAQGGVNRSWRDPRADAAVNVLGTLAVLDASVRGGASRLVFASSGGALYGDAARLPASEETPPAPRSPYGAAKLAAEQYIALYARARDVSALSLRFANVYGPGQDGSGEAGVVAITCGRLRAGRPPLVRGDGSQTRDFVFVTDVARAVVQALASDVTGVLNIGSGEATSIAAMVDALCAAAGWSGGIERGPLPGGEVRHSQLDPRRAAEALGWVGAVPLGRGLLRTWNDGAASAASESTTSVASGGT